MYWLQFIISAVIIVLAGTRLTVCADRIGDELQLGKFWVGIVLLGIATSLPEAITSLTAIISLHAHDLAVGNLLGSNNFNPMIIVVMDVLYRQRSVTNMVHPSPAHKISANFAMVLSLFVIFDILFNRAFPSFHMGPFSVGGVLIVVFYFYGIRRLSAQGLGTTGVVPAKKDHSIRWAWIQFMVSAAFLVAGAMMLTSSADTIAVKTGLGRTFVGSIFLAIITSLPEMVVSLSAMRLGALDLAVGNIFGSNMANMLILVICSLFSPARPILATVSLTHLVTAVLNILLVYVAIRGIFMRNKRTILGLGWDSVIMLLLFFGGTGFLYFIKGA